MDKENEKDDKESDFALGAKLKSEIDAQNYLAYTKCIHDSGLTDVCTTQSNYPCNSAGVSEGATYWLDITQEFFAATKSLKLGEIIHDDLFGLFEAMSAIEMMDPKMDAGMLCDRAAIKSCSVNFDDALKKNRIKLEGFDCLEQKRIMDKTISCLVSWLEGQSLAQTVFTNLYMHRPYAIHTLPLRAFCIAIYKIIESVKSFVINGMVSEDEDFQTHMYGYVLQPDTPEQKTLDLLKEAEMMESYETPEQKTDGSVELIQRIAFVRSFYELFISLNALKDNADVLTDCCNTIAKCNELLILMSNSCHDPVPKSSNDTYGFDALINQRLLPATFPRCTVIKSVPESLVFLKQLMNRLKSACKIVTLKSNFHDALDYFVEFGSGDTCVISRSVMQVLFHGNNNPLPTTSHNNWTTPQTNVAIPNPLVLSQHFRHILVESAKNFVSPPALILSMRSSALCHPDTGENIVDAFFDECIRPFTNFVQLCGHNRARQRDRLVTLLQDFANLQHQADNLDGLLKCIYEKHDVPSATPVGSACFSTWILYHVLKIMIMYLYSGFDLELYIACEYAYIYWYLSEFLYAWLVSCVNRADSMSANYEQLCDNVKIRSRHTRNKSNIKHKKKKKAIKEQIVMHQVMQKICAAYHKAMLGLQLEGKIRRPYVEFDNERMRYEHRFSPFNVLVTPPVVIHYEEFENVSSILHEAGYDTLYYTASKLFHEARKLLESCPDLRMNNLLKVVKTNYVVLNVLASGHKKSSNSSLVFDFSAHRHFPIFKLI